MIEYDVVNYLCADTTLQNLLSGSASDVKIYPDKAPQNSTEPYIVYFSGIGMLDEILDEDRIQFKIYSSNKKICTDIRNRLKKILDKQDGIQGLISSTDYIIFYSKLTAGDSSIESELNNYEIPMFFNIKFKTK